MARIELINNGVVFLEEPHEYWLTLPNGEKKQLFGITGAIQRQVAGHEYDGCPEHLIKRAGEYGTSVHKSIERLINEFEHDGTVETEDFRNLTADLNIEASEYNVSDGDFYASNIDLVCRVSDNEFDLYDIKTYSNQKLTNAQMTKVRYQLSCYSYMFELQNKGARVRQLKVIHLANKTKKDGSPVHIAEIVLIDRIPTDICKALLDADRKGEQFNNPYDVPKEIASQLVHLKELISIKNQAEQEINSMKANILQSMEFLDVTNWAKDDIKLTRKLPSTRSSLNVQLLKHDYPDIPYDDYMKESKVSGSLTISIAA